MLTPQVLDLAVEIRKILSMPDELRDLTYGYEGWKLIVLRYIELVERDN